ncbi:DUF6851 domain-containing protein [Sorangium sp. So ce726]|uniref:DUF6851 domain-containing protein n=1 Tax=Sorangium sp. So ce726 TaxID=3133319 RepID=UPI003F5DB9D0
MGNCSRVERRPSSESATNSNKKFAIFYASYHVLNSVFPRSNPRPTGRSAGGSRCP